LSRARDTLDRAPYGSRRPEEGRFPAKNCNCTPTTLADINVARHYGGIIRSFACRETAAIWDEQRSRRLPADIQQRALNKLALLNRAARLEDLRVPPSNHLEALLGNRKGQHSIRINQKWRICFRWTGADAEQVEIVDYH
jgi:toxin HigB-1